MENKNDRRNSSKCWPHTAVIYQIKAYRAGFRTILKIFELNGIFTCFTFFKNERQNPFQKLQLQAITDI